jgi:hypothetical protein
MFFFLIFSQFDSLIQLIIQIASYLINTKSVSLMSHQLLSFIQWIHQYFLIRICHMLHSILHISLYIIPSCFMSCITFHQLFVFFLLNSFHFL